MFLLPVLSSILGIVSFNADFYFLAFFALVPLFLFFIKEKNFWKLLAGAALFRLIFALGTVYFVTDPILFGLSILIFLGLPISVYLCKNFDFSRYGARIYFLLPLFWIFWDYIESQYTLLPMSIIIFGNALANSPFLGLARLGGVIGPDLFAAIINTVFAAAIILRKNKSRFILSVFLAALLIISGFALAGIFIQKNKEDYALKNRIARVALMSAPREKKFFDSELSSVVLSENTDIFIAPEDLYPHDIENYQKAIDVYSASAKKLGVMLSAVTSRIDLLSGGKNLYKSSILFSKDGEIKSIYNKVNLTITSEYWPFKNWRPFYFDYYLKQLTNLEEENRAIFDSKYQYQKGTASLLKADGFSFVSLICVEAHYPFYVKKLVGLGADFISHNSNNTWIGGGIDQYLRLTNNLRKIEAVWLNKLVLVNGIADYAGIIFPDGSSDLRGIGNQSVIFEGEIRY